MGLAELGGQSGMEEEREGSKWSLDSNAQPLCVQDEGGRGRAEPAAASSP